MRKKKRTKEELESSNEEWEQHGNIREQRLVFISSLELVLHLSDHFLIWCHAIAWDGMSVRDCLDEALFPAIWAATRC